MFKIPYLSKYLLLTACLLNGFAISLSQASGIVSSVEKAPITADGKVTDSAPDFIINLDTSLDPNIIGRTLLAGRKIKVKLPDAFVNTEQFELEDLFSSATCAPGALQCNTAIMLSGWPQHPILPSVPPGGSLQQYTLSMSGHNTFVYTANVDLVPGVALEGPGIKQLHLILNGYVNPPAGQYDIHVAAETGPGGKMEFGVGTIHITPQISPSINVTSALNPDTPNTIYQQTKVGELLPLNWDFLLWDRDGDPLKKVLVKKVDSTASPDLNMWMLTRGNKTVGYINVETPDNATGVEIFAETPSTEINAPVSGDPTALLSLMFRAGSAAGEYKATFSMNHGNSLTMYVDAVD